MRFHAHRRARVGALLALSMGLVASAASGQDVPSLASAISADPGEVWSPSGSPGDGGSSTLQCEYLIPVPTPEEAFSALEGSACNSCNNGAGGGAGGFGATMPYNRCGCDSPQFRWFAGPGNCDNWCVGPHWNVEIDGMFIRRQDAAWDSVAGVDPDSIDQFDYGPGVRLFVTGYNYTDYGLQIGYEGVNDFHSLADTGVEEINYESTLNSLEINILRRTTVPLKVFAGFRYIELDEDFVETAIATGDGDVTHVENRLIGFQIGGLRDAWQLNRWITIEPYGNVGAYLNDFKREDVDVVGGAYTAESNEFTEISFAGEAGVTSVLRFSECLALRGGYQILALSEVGEALGASLAARQFDGDTLVFHGVRFGLEYQR